VGIPHLCCLLQQGQRVLGCHWLGQSSSSSFSAGSVDFGPDVTSSDKSIKVLLNAEDKVSPCVPRGKQLPARSVPGWHRERLSGAFPP